MTTTTFSHTGSSHSSSSAIESIRAFVSAWFQATPVYFVYRALVG